MREAKWSKDTPTEQGWWWYRANKSYHPVPTFVEDCGGGAFKAVEIYEAHMVWVDSVTVDWWQEKIEVPSKCNHEMVTTGSGTYCMKSDCDVNWV